VGLHIQKKYVIGVGAVTRCMWPPWRHGKKNAIGVLYKLGCSIGSIHVARRKRAKGLRCEGWEGAEKA